MLEKPALSDAMIVASVQAGYQITPASIVFLPLGLDVHAWRYRIDLADGSSYFLKVRRPPVDELSLVIPRFLRDRGFTQVVAPLPARDGTLWQRAGDFALVIYPFIRGRTGMAGALTLGQWETLGAALRRLHDSTLPEALARAVPRDRFIPAPHVSGIVRAVLDGRHEERLTSEPRRELAVFLHEKRDEVAHILTRAEALGRRLHDTHPDIVLCHADIHINNVLVDAHDRLWIVDWDQPIFAPRERDLMCLLGSPMQGVLPGSAEEAAFFRGYGPVMIDRLALAYYRYERALQDTGENAECVYWMPDSGEETVRNAVQRLASMFNPGRQVAEALRADALVSALP